MKYHPCFVEVLITVSKTGSETMPGGQFDWGGRLLKGNGGVQRFPQRGW